MEKMCYLCKISKDVTCFGYYYRSKDKLNTSCKECVNLRWNKYYENNINYRLKRNIACSKKRKKLKHIVDIIKSNNSCYFCKEATLPCLDFHHLRDKLFEIGNLKNAGCSEETLINEIKKCILLCSNCHRKVHSNLLPLELDTKETHINIEY